MPRQLRTPDRIDNLFADSFNPHSLSLPPSLPPSLRLDPRTRPPPMPREKERGIKAWRSGLCEVDWRRKQPSLARPLWSHVTDENKERERERERLRCLNCSYEPIHIPTTETCCKVGGGAFLPAAKLSRSIRGRIFFYLNERVSGS